TGALIHGNRARHLRFDALEQPIVLQLGGAYIDEMTQCAEFAQQHGYDEVNINVGCPSDRVQHNKIGACLMAEPNIVADLVKHMQT
ncbi:tRNA-dihydrouridine synthase, partial [Pseudomonas sp. HY2-MNA-CIBAN-0224]